MIRGLRVAEVAVIQRLCAGDNRLFLRIGALLQSQFTCTEMALEATAASPAGKHLLSDRRLKDIGRDGFAALVSEHGCGELGLTLVDGDLGAEPGWRVIALDDELGNPLLVSDDTSTEASATAARTITATVEAPTSEPFALGEMMSTLTPALRAPMEVLLQARADDQRAAALEQLRYAAPPLSMVSELMPMLLADAAEMVRERAIGLLLAAGANVAVVDLVRALHRRDEAAIARLAENIAHLPAIQLDLVVSALVAATARGQASQALVNLAQRLASHLAGFRNLDRLIELLLPTRLSLLDFIRSLQDHDAARIDTILHRHLGQGAELDATIIVLLASPGQTADDALLKRGCELLLAATEEPRERMALAGALRRLDHGQHRLAKLIAARPTQLIAAYDTSVYWLLAELCRDQAIAAATAEALAEQTRKLLRDAPGPHLVAMLEQQLPALLPASESARGAQVEPLVEVVARFRDERSLDLVGSCLTAIGKAATVPMWQLLEEHPHQTVRLLAADLLPQLIAGSESGPAAVKRLLAGLTRAVQANERGALVTAAARIATAAGLPTATIQQIDQATVGLGEWAIDAYGHLAAGMACPDDRRRAILDLLITMVREDLPDHPLEQITDPATSDVTFVLDPSLGAHTQNVPRVLTALYRIGCSPHLPAADLERMVDSLCQQWKQVSNWEVVWGPANIQELGRTLGQLAGRLTFPGPLRVRICEALLPKLSQIGIARSLARVFVAADGPYLSQLAGRACERLVQLATDNYYAEDELPDLVETLVDFLVIPHLGDKGDSVRRRMINLVLAYRTHCTSRSRAKLRALMPDLSADLRGRLDWV